MAQHTAPEDRRRHPRTDELREQAVARAGAYLERWWEDRDDLRELERAELALREALES